MRKTLLRWRLPDAGAGRTGVVGVRLDEDQLEMVHLAGACPPATILYPLLRAALPDEVWAEAERRHRARAHPWRVEVRRGMSGCRDYILRYLRAPEWGLTGRGGTLHVSMYGQLNQGVRLPLMDLPPLLAAVLADFPSREVDIREIRPANPEEFIPAGETSGLQEILEAQRVIDMLGGGDA